LHNPYAGPAELPASVQKDHAAPEVILYEGRQGTVHIRLLADYKVTAAVKGKQPYTSDTASQVSPMDLVLAWEIMNQPDPGHCFLHTGKHRQSTSDSRE
jgi:hypothetical protein